MLRKFGNLLAAAAFVAGTGMASAQETVRIAHSTESFAFMPFFVATSMGYFEQAGIDAEVVRTGSGSKTVAAVVGRSADVAIGSSSSIMFARKEGVDLVMFAGLVDQYTTGLVFSKDWAASHNLTPDSSEEERLAALRGVRISTSGPGGGDQYIRYFAEKAGLDADSEITIVHLGNDNAVHLAALDEGRIDAVAMSEPVTTLAVLEHGAVEGFNAAAGRVPELDGFLYIVAHAQRSWLENNPDTARKVVQAFQMALDAFKDPATSEAAREAVKTQYFPDVDPTLFDAVWEDFALSSADDTVITREAIERIVAFSNTFEENQIDPAAIEGSFTAEFAPAN